jgi:hypothetical protein
MKIEMIEKMIKICDEKIATKGDNVGISFYVFFKNKNDNPDLLLEVATWWILMYKLDHFEKAIKIKDLLNVFKETLNS